jgi:hypothetical protein
MNETPRLDPQANRVFPWRKAFLDALREDGKVINACKAAGISRNSAYAHRRRYPRFRKRWDRAQEAGWEARWDAWDDEFFAELERQTGVPGNKIAV